jgi:phosphoribosyl-AMP cyclohydrolase / phosphoribosyl-ATP pyrophosphohydrolase
MSGPRLEPAWDDRGLVPAIVQDAATGAVLMMAWMNAEALRLTRETGFAHFWSRSRARLWKKGETSGHTLAVAEVRIDCDADAILVRATPAGPACHTGQPTCFFREPGGRADAALPTSAPTIFDRVERVIAARRDDPATTGKVSYTRSLLDAGWPRMLAKIAEEHGELAAELPAGDDHDVVHEAADLIFHVLVALGSRRIPLAAIEAELDRRFGTGGHVEKAARPAEPDPKPQG